MTRPSVVRQRYSGGAKELARALVVAAAADVKAESILDLGGLGGSARAFRAALPEAAVVSCETDQDLWPALRLDAQQNGYAFFGGDFRKAGGKYDLIYLDLCAQWCGSAREAAVAASRMLTPNGYLAVTLLAARESPEIAADRLYLVPRSLERATGLSVRVLYPYQTASPMWLLVLHEGLSLWSDDIDRRMPRDTTPFDDIARELAEDGFWAFNSLWASQILTPYEPKPAAPRLAAMKAYAKKYPNLMALATAAER